LAQEVENVIRACNDLIAEMERHRIPVLSRELITTYNGKALHGLEVAESVVPGQIRTHSVGIPGVNYRGAPWRDCEYLLDRLCEWLNGWPEPPADQPRFLHAILKAVLAHIYLAWIHPFGDGNGRTARLIEWHILLSVSVPVPAAHLLSNHYNLTRGEYYRQLARASQSGGDVLPFIAYALRGFVDGLQVQLGLIREQQWSVSWENFVHDTFHGEHGPTAERRKHLALDLAKKTQPISRAGLRELSPRVARAYATKTDMTLSRDLNALEAKRLVQRTREGWRARREIVLAFLPPQAKG
jgi:hypothetical protein